MAKLPTVVPVRDLKNRLSAYVRLVRAGREVVVTSRGEPVARLVPFARARDPEQEAVARLRSLPFVRPGRPGPVRGSRRPTPWKPGDLLISDIISEQRE